MSLTNSQYDQLMRIYSLRQSENERALEKRRREAYAAIPALRSLDEEVSAAAVESARSRLAGDSHRADLLQASIPEIAAKRKQLLAAAGFPDNYLQMQYHCTDCRDTGYIGSQRCHCLLRQAVDLFYTQSGLRNILAEENFQNFRLDYYPDREVNPVTGLTSRQNMQRILNTALEFVNGFSHRGASEEAIRNLFLYGGTGLGKTFLSHCIAKELLDQAFSVIYYSAFELFEMMARDTFGKGNRDEQEELPAGCLLDCDLLIIDDLGTEMTNTFVASSLFQILNERILREKSTLISTNLSLSAFADTYTERVFSRITSSYTLLGLYGDDIRLKKALRKIGS